MSIGRFCPVGDFGEGAAAVVALDKPVHSPISRLQIELPSGTAPGPKRIELLIELRSAVTSRGQFLAQGLAMEREPRFQIGDRWVPIIGNGTRAEPPRPETLTG